jgi:hydroxyacylglutathione hydrolase
MNEHIWMGVLPVGPLMTNCYILGNDDRREAVLVDPGDDADTILSVLKDRQLTAAAILLTHAHYDHILAVNEIAKAYPSASICILEEEKKMVEDPSLNSGIGGHTVTITPTTYVHHNDRLSFAGAEFTVLASPGHTAGSCCYYMEGQKTLFAGDTIFQGSYGRTDLPTGSFEKMQESLFCLLTTLPEDVRVYPGHGPATTIGDEKRIEGFAP